MLGNRKNIPRHPPQLGHQPGEPGANEEVNIKERNPLHNDDKTCSNSPGGPAGPATNSSEKAALFVHISISTATAATKAIVIISLLVVRQPGCSKSSRSLPHRIVDVVLVCTNRIPIISHRQTVRRDGPRRRASTSTQHQVSYRDCGSLAVN